jgi:hypothetical protein
MITPEVGLFNEMLEIRSGLGTSVLGPKVSHVWLRTGTVTDENLEGLIHLTWLPSLRISQILKTERRRAGRNEEAEHGQQKYSTKRVNRMRQSR